MSNIFSMTDTWNAGATTFTAVQMNVTDTASTAGSLLMDLQVGGTSKFSVSKGGNITANALNLAAYVTANGGFGTSSDSAIYNFGAANDLKLARDAANTLAQRNGVNAQTLNLYNTYTDAVNYERGFLSWTASTNTFTLGTQSAGTGAARYINIQAQLIQFVIGSTGIFSINAGSLYANADNTSDIGLVGNAPRYIRAASAIQTKALTVATLPAAATALAGARSFVTDSSVTAAGNFGAIVAGAGANATPVYSDGTNWRIG